MKSSYIRHNYGSLIRSLIKVTSPKCCVEFGILDGFSTIAIGSTLKDLSGGRRRLYAYDLFERYPYTHAEYADVAARIDRFGLKEIIELRQKDIFEAVDDFGKESIDFMHVDISNTGDIIRNVIAKWDEKILPGGVLLFEGGSPLRDEVSWMKRYNKEKISIEINSNATLEQSYTSLVLHPYPSVVVCSKNVKVDQETWNKFGYNDYENDRRHDELDNGEFIRVI